METKHKNIIENVTNDKLLLSSPISGGSIAKTEILNFNSGKKLIYKTISDCCYDNMFIKEATGLQELKKANAIRVPKVIYSENSFILMEYITQGNPGPDFFSRFGTQFAKLHRFTGKKFGFFEDNFIGSNIQRNTPQYDNWPSFFFEQRIYFQYRLAEKNRFATKDLTYKISSLEKKINEFLKGSEEPPTLLHGDLWSGNFLIDSTGEPCLIDPATYYGHREADLAMTELFGGFGQDFYSSYNNEFPLVAGYNSRKKLYQLYHVMNHMNLFGRSYYNQTMDLLISIKY